MLDLDDRALSSHAATGITGLDNILGGGFARPYAYLIQGAPGSGKTTLALQFLLTGAAVNERGLYITLSESAAELRSNADAHGWSLDKIEVAELSTAEDIRSADEQSILFHPFEIELGETMRALFATVDAARPTRVVVDSLSELRMLAQTSLRYRRQVMALKQFFAERQCTVLLLDDGTSGDHEQQLASIAHGVLYLEQLAPEYGAERRRLRVSKYRGQGFRGGYHDYRITAGGVRVFPRLVAAEHHATFTSELLRSGVEELDTLLGGGLTYGTSTLIIGPAGTGKSSLATCYALAAVQRGEHAAMFVFDELLSVLKARSAGIGLDIQPYIANGRMWLQQIDPAELAPGEFVNLVREVVEREQTRLVVIDSLNGYLHAMPDERFLVVLLHELFAYLGQRGVVTVLIVGQHGIVGQGMSTPVDVSYVADTVMLLRYFESAGTVRQAISVVKRRSGPHERAIRELRIEPGALRVGAPLTQFQGVLTGTPSYLGGGGIQLETPDATTG
jgi:circadian clock protein KaiC